MTAVTPGAPYCAALQRGLAKGFSHQFLTCAPERISIVRIQRVWAHAFASDVLDDDLVCDDLPYMNLSHY